MWLHTFMEAGVRRFTHLHGLADVWQHIVTLEELVPPDTNQHTIVCEAAGNVCPPKDVGGRNGYADFLKAVADPRHEEHTDILAWTGGSFDLTALHLQATKRIPKTSKP